MNLEDRSETPTVHANRLIAQAIIDCHSKPSLREAILDFANLSGADISHFDLRFAQFRDCNLRNVELPQTIPREGEPNYSDALRDESDPDVPGWEVVGGRMQRSSIGHAEPETLSESLNDQERDYWDGNERDKNGIDRDGSDWFTEDDE